MARYATTEERFDCKGCFISCTQREMVTEGLDDWILSCPNCYCAMLNVRPDDKKIFGVYGTPSEGGMLMVNGFELNG